MTRSTTLPRRISGMSGALCLAAVLTGCGGGDELALGASADIDYHAPGGTGAVASGTVTVTGVREGSTAELEEGGLGLDDDERSGSVYYVDVEFTNDGDVAAPPGRPSGEDPDENLISPLVVLDFGGEPLATCAGVPEEIPAGETVEGCTILLVPDGVELARIAYFPGGGADFVYWETGL